MLESTRNYLKSSTKLGRRLSNHRDESSASEGSVHSIAPSNVENPKQPQQHHRSTSQIRLSSLFAFEGKNRSSVSTEDRATVNSARKMGSETHDRPQQDNKKKRRSSSSQKSTQSLPATTTDSSPPSDKARRSATAASMYDARPDDYPSIDQYQAHVWRRNLLEESIMHSLKLGFAATPPSRSAKRTATDRSRKSLGAAGDSTVVLDRGLSPNSPYQMVNSSTTNITQSYTSFTLELPEDHVAQVLSSSAVPHLFKIKQTEVRGQRDSNATRILHTGPSPSPRVLTGKTASRHMGYKENMDPRHMPQVVAAAV